ncbi:ubiquinol-cytochrome c reductase complex assembly factor 4 [Syngnathus typhle]|uniref:ubiquinol-cytochrome c reductase complex assembly factor 4 n=1 Tax=Syngnathus typhle TaxID=161592 RepID=UPI002A6AD8A3|nr:ubiquinol-cytochrome c reductase complex assembly factor 4 [Syngnathus typhle]
MFHVFTGLTSKTFSRGTLTLIRHTNACRVRPLSVSHHRLAKSEQPEDVQEVNNEPIRFSTSKASHKTWKVERSMGSQYQRPWWKVLPISVIGIGFLLWCVMREESDIDTQLEKELYQHLPGLLADQENEKK